MVAGRWTYTDERGSDDRHTYRIAEIRFASAKEALLVDISSLREESDV